MSDPVLLVDDDPTLLRAVKRSLEDEFEVFTASSGADALALLESGQSISVVVSDMKMPQMDGVELVLKIRERWPLIPCIILTGNQDEDSMTRVVEVAKAFKLLNKPSPRAELIQGIQSALDTYRDGMTRA